MKRNEFGTLSRRDFGRLAGAVAAGVSLDLLPGFARLALAADDPGKIIPGKSQEMIIHNGKLGVMETPITLLRKYEHTPKEILFVRYHFPHDGDAGWLASLDASRNKDWTLEIDGLVQRPRRVKLSEIESMDKVKRVSVLQCAGNGRSFYAEKQKVAGGQWKNGGMGNVEWEGVPLRHFLDQMKVVPAASAHWLSAEGWDQPATPEGSDFSKSYHLNDSALDNAIIATRMNGEPIPSAHGGPLRLIIPGFYGNMNVKQLTKLLLMPEQAPSVFQRVAYRMPLSLPVEPGGFGADDYTIYNSRPTYGHAIKSVIFSPLPTDRPSSGQVQITGVAFNDGRAPITDVEVSSDGGKTWRKATIKPPESPWAWHHFQAQGSLSPGSNVLMSRATDALGRTQPIDGLARWNPRGYEWNGVERLSITV